ncbi:HAD family hydrolase [Olsenella phocaeensis]|uniref:HAD family hydrolase n=1 Tax=Olsenella phocaeensis TaxID=1852385 RepID=UPI0026DAC37D|nr:HAD family hydrolase [uncultured Olsenella sp.]
MATDVRLILTDIDGTILPYGQKVVGRRTLAAFHRALDAGLRIGPASGRGHQWIAPLLGGDEACCATALASNGMQVYLDGELVHEELLTQGALRRLAKAVAGIGGAGAVVFDDATPLLVQGSLDDLEACFPSYAARCRVVDDVPVASAVKANVFLDGDLAAMHELADRLASELPELAFDVPQPGWINVMTAGWGKGPAIDVLCERLGIGLDQVAVFGDGGNDVSMLEHVPLSFAVEGAAPEAKAAASRQLGRVEDEAVAGAVDALVRGEMPR